MEGGAERVANASGRPWGAPAAQVLGALPPRGAGPADLAQSTPPFNNQPSRPFSCCPIAAAFQSLPAALPTAAAFQSASPQYHKKIKDENSGLREELGRLRIEAHRTQARRKGDGAGWTGSVVDV